MSEHISVDNNARETVFCALREQIDSSSTTVASTPPPCDDALLLEQLCQRDGRATSETQSQRAAGEADTEAPLEVEGGLSVQDGEAVEEKENECLTRLIPTAPEFVPGACKHIRPTHTLSEFGLYDSILSYSREQIDSGSTTVASTPRPCGDASLLEQLRHEVKIDLVERDGRVTSETLTQLGTEEADTEMPLSIEKLALSHSSEVTDEEEDVLCKKGRFEALIADIYARNGLLDLYEPCSFQQPSVET